MGRSTETSNKKDNEKKKIQKRKEKEQRREERKANSKEGKNWEEMVAYVDENGNITNTPPDPTKKKVIKEDEIEIGVPRQAHTQQERFRKGIVSFFNDSKGYGFIKDSDSHDSIFVHANGLMEPIRENNKVTFEVEMGHKGPHAVNVKVVR